MLLPLEEEEEEEEAPLGGLEEEEEEEAAEGAGGPEEAELPVEDEDFGFLLPFCSFDTCNTRKERDWIRLN